MSTDTGIIKESIRQCIKARTYTCVAADSQSIVYQASGKCVRPIIVPMRTDRSFFEGKYVADTMVGKAAALLLALSGARYVYGEIMSQAAVPVLKENGMEDRAVVVGNEFSVQNGYLETKLLLNREKRPTAIFALSNNIGMGVIKAVREAGLRIPDDISLVSFDNYLYLDFLEPAITRVGQMVDEMGKMAVKLLNESISNHKEIKSQIELSPEMILRDSVSPLLQH